MEILSDKQIDDVAGAELTYEEEQLLQEHNRQLQEEEMRRRFGDGI